MDNYFFFNPPPSRFPCKLKSYYFTGISLSLDQWEKLKESLADIDSKIDELR